MKSILNISSSVRGKESASIQLSNVILEKLSSVYPGSHIHTHDLSKTPLPHLTGTHLAAFYAPQEVPADEYREAIRYSDEAIKELMGADVLVIGVPLYNFGIPSTLKAWIDHIVRAGVTFQYVAGAPEGLLKNKTVYLAIASGGIYSEGPMKHFDFTESYLRTALGLIGLKEIKAFRVEGAIVPALKETAFSTAIESVNNYPFESNN